MVHKLNRTFYVAFYENLSMNLLIYGGDECANRLQDAFNEITRLIEQGNGKVLQERLKLCSEFNTESKQEIALLFYLIIDLIDENINDEGYVKMLD